jgi:WD40 repeat protein
MEALYDRMAAAIRDFRVTTDKSLATSILRCVITSMRLLTLTELAQALSEGTSKMLDMRMAVVDLCAGFVVIDNDGNITMVHQTAREYLLATEADHPLSFRESEAHESMFISCMRSLMKLDLRPKILAQHIPDFYDYAATFWSKHLLDSPKDSQEVATALGKFLSGQWALTWIQYLSSSNQLDVLVQVSRHLSRYFAKCQRHDTGVAYTGAQMMKQALLEGWTTDLIKLVGKFGVILREEPESIYKLIAPFCPTTSSMWQLFGKGEARSLSVMGLSTDKWDDSLARISLGTRAFTTSLTTAGRVIALLASSGPVLKAYLYNATTFESLTCGIIAHGERVQRMELNQTGTLLATYGYRTTKVWNTTDGTCTVVVDNQIGKTPLAMLFVNNSDELLIGTDDRCLRSLDLTQRAPSWQVVAELEEDEVEGLHLNAASFMAINRDASLVAVASRGHPPSAWEVYGPTLIRHCWRTREQVTFGQVIDAAWNPLSPELFGLYYEGTLFRWRPYDDDYDELTVRASKLSISKDGNLIATGDGRGAIKVFTTDDMALLYQLVAEDTVLGLTFSPDLRRIYDIRGQYANVWEPNALIKFAEQREKGADGYSETESIAVNSTATVAARQDRVHTVTALGACPTGGIFAYGTDKGHVHLYDTRSDKPFKIYSAKSFFSIEKMAWSPNGRYLAFSFSGKRVIIMAITTLPTLAQGQSGPIVELQLDTVVNTKATNAIVTQILFDSSSTRLAVMSPTLLQVISLEKPDNIDTRVLLNNPGTVWINHPADSTLLAGISAGVVNIIGWQSLVDIRYQFDLPGAEQSQRENPPTNVTKEAFPPLTFPNLEGATVERVIVTGSRKNHLVVQLDCPRTSSTRKLYLSLDISDPQLHPAQTVDVDAALANNKVPVSQFFPPQVSADVSCMLEFLSRDRMVHISRSFAIRTWLGSTASSSHGSHRSTDARISGRSAYTPHTPSEIRPIIPRQLSLPDQSSLLGASAKANSDEEPKVDKGSIIGLEPPSRQPLLGTPKPHTRSLSQIRGDNANRVATPFKTLFYLPGDWIGHEGVSLCVLWAKEKALLYPRNGEIAMVRCAGLV